jgi:DNA-binding HxlR family transcriptional regulator
MRNITSESCAKARLAIKDTLDVVGGKWKLILLSVLRRKEMGFNELSREAGISPRILSKELQEMESNGLVIRTVCPTKPISVKYALASYAHSLDNVLEAMEAWGHQHRNRIIAEFK